MAKVQVRFYLDDHRDADIRAWLAEQPNRSLAVRQALRAWMSRTDGLGVSVQGGASAAPETPKEDEDVAEALDSLMGAWADLGADNE